MIDNTPFFSHPLSHCLVLIVAVGFASAAGVSDTELSRRMVVMGTVLELEISARDRQTVFAASEAAVDAIEAADRRLSTWREDSELSRLNRAVLGTPVRISPELEADLRDAQHWWSETGGLFDPGVASLVEAWGLRSGGRLPAPPELDAARVAAGFEHLVLEPEIAWRAVTGFGIEEGGFGKGIALRDAATAAVEAAASCVMIDLGGQVVVSGACGTRYIDIAHPGRRERVVARVSLKSGSAATSGNSERGVLVDGVSYGHLLDPTTGRPAPDWGAVTVVAADPVAADCLATALFVMGPQRGAEWLRGRPDVEAVFAKTDGKSMMLTATSGLRGRLVVFEGEMRYLPPPRKGRDQGGRQDLEIAERNTGN